jgi:hypothetical protein
MDRTRHAIMRQLRGMSCDLFEVGIRDQHSGKMQNRIWRPSQLLTYVPWLKHANACNHDIYVRPACEARPHGLVLLDDLKEHSIHAMATVGHHPAVLLETSPENYQAWLRFAPPPNDDIRGLLAKLLASTYHADLNSADSRHYGRLAGFTNRKKKYRYLKRPVWVLLRRSTGAVTKLSEQLIRKATSNQSPIRRDTRPKQLQNMPGLEKGRCVYSRVLDGLLQRYGQQLDYSRADWAAAKRLSRLGFQTQQIEQILLELSPNLGERKKGHHIDYVVRTAAKATR